MIPIELFLPSPSRFDLAPSGGSARWVSIEGGGTCDDEGMMGSGVESDSFTGDVADIWFVSGGSWEGC